MIRIDEAVLERAEAARAADGQGWTIDMQLSSETAVEVTEGALSDAVGDMVRRRLAQPDDSAFEGEWDWLCLDDAVAITVSESDDFAAALEDVVEGLTVRGVSGSIELLQHAPAEQPPNVADLLILQTRLRGDREHRGPSSYRWVADTDAAAAVVAAAETWLRLKPDAVLTLQVGRSRPLRVAGKKPSAPRVMHAIARGDVPVLMAVADNGFRAFSVNHSEGAASVVVGCTEEHDGWWRTELAGLEDLMASLAGHAVYAYIRRGWNVDQALLLDRPGADWPSRSSAYPRGRGHTRRSFDDLVVPDVFGVQLLTAGHLDRVPDASAWTSEAVGESARVVRARAIEDWFADPFVPVGQITASQDRKTPAALQAARDDFHALLYERGGLARWGIADVDQDT